MSVIWLLISFSISFNQTGKCSQYNCEKYRFHSIGGGGVKTGLFVFLLRSSDGFCWRIFPEQLTWCASA